jgi:hypothetical protein
MRHLLFTNGAFSVKADEVQRRERDWDRRQIVLEGDWPTARAAVSEFEGRPYQLNPDVWWPDAVIATPTGGGLIRVTLELQGLIGADEKWYELTEDNGELQSYQLQNMTVSAPEFGWSPATYERVNVEVGTPKLGWLHFGRTTPDPTQNGHPVPRPVRGVFPTVPTPPWRVSAGAVSVTANFPGGWRQLAAPYSRLGGYTDTGFALLTVPLYRGEWHYGHVWKETL